MVITKVEKLENEVQQLNPGELAAFRDWFRKYDSAQWDREIGKDILAGRLERLNLRLECGNLHQNRRTRHARSLV